MKDALRKAFNVGYTWGYDPDYTKLYIEKYVALDPFTMGQFLFEVGQVISLIDLVSLEELRESKFYLEWVRPQRWADALCSTLEKTNTSYAAVSVIRHERNGLADEQARSRMRLILPHVRRAVLIGKVLDLTKIEAAQLADTFDGLAAGTFLADANGRIVYANAAGDALLAEGSPVRAAAGKLALVDDTANRLLHDILIKAPAGDAAVGAKGITVSLGGHAGENWVAHVLPLTSGTRRKTGTSYSAVAAIFVRKAGLDLPHPLEALAGRYKLTPAEMRVLMAIVEIGGVPEIAPVLGMSETTVKTHLYHVFEKTGAKRQADLVKLVAGFMSPLG
jgi:DNA-binding CsgD family transcriptional regulator